MAIKAVEMVRKIRDTHYEQTKDLSYEEQMRLVKKGSEALRKSLGVGGERKKKVGK